MATQMASNHRPILIASGRSFVERGSCSEQALTLALAEPGRGRLPAAGCLQGDAT